MLYGVFSDVHSNREALEAVLGFFEDVFSRLPVPALTAPLRRAVHEKVGHLHGRDA